MAVPAVASTSRRVYEGATRVLREWDGGLGSMAALAEECEVGGLLVVVGDLDLELERAPCIIASFEKRLPGLSRAAPS